MASLAYPAAILPPDQPIIESRSQVLHLIRVALVPSLRSLPLSSRVVALDPHLGQLGTSPLTPLDPCTSERTRVFLESPSRSFSEGCFVSFVMLPVLIVNCGETA